MVEAVRRGASQREVARRFGVSLRTVQKWLERAGRTRLDRVDFSSHVRRPKHVARKTSRELEATILGVRKQLRETSELGEYGAEAIHRRLSELNEPEIPSVRTINRILKRHGAFDRRQRTRREAPPAGWYLPDVADGRADVDEVDIVEGLALKGGIRIEVLNLISLHGALVNSWPHAGSTRATMVVDCLLEHWRCFGLPGYAQFDNDTRFQAAHQHQDVISRVMRVCLSLKVTPVFAPPRELGFQASIENYNGRWQAKLWARFEHPSVAALIAASDRFVAAAHQRYAVRIEAAPARRAFPKNWSLNLQKHPTGRLIFLRRTGENGNVSLLGRTFEADRTWCHRLVRCEVDLSKHRIAIHALRRGDPTEQPLLAEHPYQLPKRHFQE